MRNENPEKALAGIHDEHRPGVHRLKGWLVDEACEQPRTRLCLERRLGRQPDWRGGRIIRGIVVEAFGLGTGRSFTTRGPDPDDTGYAPATEPGPRIEPRLDD